MQIASVRVHRLKNQLAIILGFSELLLEEMPAEDSRRPDVEQIQRAARSALGELPPLPAHEFASAAERREEPANDNQ
jgi:signal transduction histidine kinase